MVLSRVTSQPASEPVSVSEAKEHMRVETALDDSYIGVLVTAARKWAENYCRRGFVTQTWESTFDAFEDGLELPGGTLQSITSVQYYDANSTLQTLSTSVYAADVLSVPGKLRLKTDQDWPDVSGAWNSVVVTYVVGASAGSVEAPVKQAIMLLVSQMYEHRTPEVIAANISHVSFAVEALLSPYRLVKVA